MSTKVAGVVGRNGAGKDAVVDHLHERCGVVKLSAGNLVRDLAAREDLPPTRENLHAVSLKAMQREGPDVIARRLIAVIEDHDWRAVAVSGIRSPHDAGTFQGFFGDDFRLVYVRVGDPRLRFERLRRRGSSRDPETWEAFQEQEREEEAHFDIGRSIALADITIPNDRSKEALERQIETSPLWTWICAGPAG